MLNRLVCIVTLLLMAVTGLHAEGTGWRGDGSGRYPQAEAPSEWDADEGKNILWKTEVGKGQSSPVVAGDKVFITAEPELLRCLDRKTGKVLWTRENGYAALAPGTQVPEQRPPTAPTCGYSTPTPVTDGQFVYASYGTGVVACCDLDGKGAWIRFLDLPQDSEYGRSASPVLAGGKLLVTIGGLVALDPKTGNTLWHRPEARAAFGSPAVTRIGDVDVAITPNGDCVRVSDGKILARKLAGAQCTSPIVAAGIVYFAAPPAVAWKLPEKADEAMKPEKLWENEDLEGELFSSPVLHDGILYCVSNSGVLYALDAKTGKALYTKELQIGCQSGRPGLESANLYPSLALVGKHLLLANDIGQALVLAPGKEYKEVSRCTLSKGSAASPAVEGNLVFLRGGTKLYCIGGR